MQLDASTSGLIGAVIGGVIGTAGTLITAWTTARRERIAFDRSQAEQHLNRVREVYDHALNILFNMERGGMPDRASLGTAFARVSLHGSAEVDRIVQTYVNAPAQQRAIDMSRVIAAMKAHLSELESHLYGA
jgi:hypothetical protein